MVITGGEPLIFEEIGSLTRELPNHRKHITIETAGTLDADADCDLWSIIPKLSNSSPIGYASRNGCKPRYTSDPTGRGPVVYVAWRLPAQVCRGIDFDAEEVLEYLGKLSGWEAKQSFC